MKNSLSSVLKNILSDLGITGVEPVVEISDDPAHGEYTTNIAMRLKSIPGIKAAPIPGIESKSPMEFAQEIAQKIHKLHHSLSPQSPLLLLLQAIDHIEVAPPGFINFFLTEAKLSSQLAEVLKEKESFGTTKSKIPKGIMVEYGDPNTHKAFHIGHLRNISIGESVVRLLEAAGADVIHTSYQGDVGMHIAKALYALLQISNVKSQMSNIRTKDIHEKVDFIGKAYVAGSKAFEESEEAKKIIGEMNKKIYAKDLSVYPIYQETRQWSLDYFDRIYKRVGTLYKRNYFESEVYEVGKKNVLDGLKRGIFEESKEAIIFPGEKYGLHNRVFVTGEGNPTYEGKDMGLGPLQYNDLKRWTKNPSLVIRVVGPEQAGYFQVIFEAHSQLFPELRDKFYHLIAGWVKLKHGKMSSRTGQVVLGEWLLDEAKKSIYEILDKSASKKDSRNQRNSDSGNRDEIAERAALAAVKYAFLKVSTKQEIAFDLKESVSFEGDSGPYLLYTYARAKSVLRKSSTSDVEQIGHIGNPEELALARLIYFFPEIVEKAALELSPNVLCSYLFSLAQAFNLFYQKHAILGTDSRLVLTAATAQILKNGLYLLGIGTVERM